MKSKFTASILATFFTLVATQNAAACACGAGVFDMATSSLIPNKKENTAFLQYDYINQDKNWNGANSAPESDNHHKKVQTQTVTLGMQTMFNRSWGLNVRVPYVNRQANMINEHHHGHHTHEEPAKVNVNSLGDIRLNGIYSGFFDDMSTGVTFGVKLPTGKYRANDLHDRPLQIGTGSTDIILGAYHLGKITDDGVMNYFIQTSWQKPVEIKDDYRPGDEFNLSVGANYDLGQVGVFKKVSPILQLVLTDKLKNKGINAAAEGSGYSRAMIAPGIEANYQQFRFYADFGLPVYNDVRDNQLVATTIFKFIIGYKF
jgi:hypothetical protein